jgi:dTDP-glucose pyrophosphorylase
MNIVIPMAGRGSRFATIGIATPKPLIDVRGRPMYAWAVESLPLAAATGMIFIVLREHLADGKLASDIRARYGAFDPQIIPLDQVTQGQACTVLEAAGLVDTDEALLIYNADTFCRTGLERTLQTLPQTVRGILGVFEAPGDKWSFARTDETGRVVETSEKRRISPWCSTGLYYFTSGREFVHYARRMIDANDRVGNEFYVAPVYNRMIADGLDVRIDVAEEVWVLGTPEDLAHFESNYPRMS